MPGWVTRQGDRDCYMQESSWACGLACMAMVINRHGHGHPTARAIASASQAHGGSYNPANIDRAGFKNLMPQSQALSVQLVTALAKRRRAIAPGDNPLASDTPQGIVQTAREGENPGMTPYNIVATLRRQYGINTARYVDLDENAVGPLKALMADASPAHPVILALDEPDHFVLCEGLVQDTNNRYVIVDPADGVRYSDGRLSVNATLRFSGTNYATTVSEAIVT